MIVDSSALIALIRQEPDAERYRTALFVTEAPPRISAPTFVESAVVADSDRVRGGHRLDALVRDAHLEVVAFDLEMARAARAAYQDYGKGSGHPAQLNFGDCFSYALATITGEPLLYKGDDFGHTDIRSALEDLKPGI